MLDLGSFSGLIVRARGGLVEARSRFAAAENRSPCPAQRSGGHHPVYPRPVAPLPQREGLLALLLGAPALLLPYVVLPGPAQSAHPSPRARAARVAASLGPRTRLSFGRLSSDGHDAGFGHREGEGFSQGARIADVLSRHGLGWPQKSIVGQRLRICDQARPLPCPSSTRVGSH